VIEVTDILAPILELLPFALLVALPIIGVRALAAGDVGGPDRRRSPIARRA
jgi:hypothetical protein